MFIYTWYFYYSIIHAFIIAGVSVAIAMGIMNVAVRLFRGLTNQGQERTPSIPKDRKRPVPTRKARILTTSIVCVVAFTISTTLITEQLAHIDGEPVFLSFIVSATLFLAGVAICGLPYLAVKKWRAYREKRAQPAPEGDTRPLVPRQIRDARTAMDGSRLTIFYTDAEGQDTKRTIRCQELGYHQDGVEVIPYMIKAHCELRGEDRTFIPRRIARATLVDGTPLFDITAFLVAHADLPRQDGPAQESAAEEMPPQSPQPAEAPPEDTTKRTNQNFYGVLDVQNGLRIPPPSETPDNVTSKLFHPDTKRCRLRITRAWGRDPKHAKESTINPIKLTYFMEDKTLCIMMIEAFIEEKKEWDSVDYTEILTATDLETGETIDNLGLYLLGDNFKHYDPYARVPEPKHKRIALKDTPITLSFTQKGSAGREVTLIVKDMWTETDYPYGPEDTRLSSVSGINAKTNAERTIRAERITDAHDPETGEVIDDLLAFLETRRKRKVKA
ncbi:hypothetical protein [Saccharibacter sp. EH60]|nr:hypothetical protein [Saccharibacter sp. EH60]